MALAESPLPLTVSSDVAATDDASCDGIANGGNVDDDVEWANAPDALSERRMRAGIDSLHRQAESDLLDALRQTQV